MSLVLRSYLGFRWLNLPGAVLIALLQRTPALRVATLAEGWVGASPLGAVLRSAFTAAASLGALHTLAGATQFVVNPNPVNGTVGSSVAVAFTVTGAGAVPGSYRVASGQLPPGVNLAGANSNGVLNVNNPSGSGAITGTPTTAGIFVISLLAFQFANAQGDTIGPAIINFNIAGAATVAPASTA